MVDIAARGWRELDHPFGPLPATTASCSHCMTDAWRGTGLGWGAMVGPNNKPDTYLLVGLASRFGPAISDDTFNSYYIAGLG